MTSTTTTDPTEPGIVRGSDDEPVEQGPVYLVLSEDERAKGYVRPYRDTYTHTVCGGTPRSTTRR